MDKTLIDIFSILIGGAGVIGAITRYKNPEIRRTFYSKDLFGDKTDIIDGFVVWVFTGFTVIGLVIQLIAKIYSNAIPDRLYNSNSYWVYSFLGIVLTVLAVIFLLFISRQLARLSWYPKMAKELKDQILTAHNLLLDDEKEGMNKEANMKQAEKSSFLLKGFWKLIQRRVTYVID